MNRFDSISPLDFRYYGEPAFFRRVQPYMSETAYIRYLLRFELTLVRMLAKWGICPHDVPGQVEAACRQITPEEVYDEEKRVHHNIRALVNCIRKRIPESSRPYVHLFATSADVMDSATALRFKEFVQDVLLPDLINLEMTLIGLARQNAETKQIGRTHGQHAVPTTFGYAMALFVSRIGSRIEAIDRASRNLRGKFSGAVGAFNALSLYSDDPSLYERELLAALDLQPSDTSTSSQIVEPESLTDLVYTITSCFSVLANIADDLRHLIRTEIGEVLDKYEDLEVGSSTMPHKMNPKNFENVKSLWKEFMPRMMTVFMDQVSEHQRDLTNSASARFLPELFTGFAYAIYRLSDALKKITVNLPRIETHLELSKDLVVAEPLYIVLALQGVPDAYDTIMRLSREARRTDTKIIDLARREPELSRILEGIPKRQADILNDPGSYVGDAANRTRATCEHWELACDLLSRNLAAEHSAKIRHEERDSEPSGYMPVA